MKSLRLWLLAVLAFAAANPAHSFCGFYVAGAGAELFNQASQVIVVRDGNHTVLTMQNDFQGSVKDFAMVIPVPVVLKREQIRIADPGLFGYLDKYTGPRLAEYYDENPCHRPRYDMAPSMGAGSMNKSAEMPGADIRTKDYQVKIEAQYAVGEYDIIILSAKDSGGLERWLKDNGYHIPDNAREVLNPYIRNDLKFFVVKVNLEKQEKQGFTALRPLQISYESERFILPIRLGMANAKGFQDLIVYAFSRKGRIETANYRTAKIPTNEDVPTRIKTDFGNFYKAVFDRAWKKEGRTSVLLEYAWDLSSTNFVKCDPCATDPMTFAQIKEAGVRWITQGGNSRGWGSADYEGPLFVTRLHVRYDRANYPEDLAFVNTPNTENFQGRYVIRHPAGGDLTCTEGRRYQSELQQRQQREERNLTALTGWRADGKTYYDDTDDDSLPGGATGNGGNGGPRLPIFLGALALLLTILVLPRLLHRLSTRLA